MQVKYDKSACIRKTGANSRETAAKEGDFERKTVGTGAQSTRNGSGKVCPKERKGDFRDEKQVRQTKIKG